MTSAESKPELHPEIAHVLFIDVVGYSKLLINVFPFFEISNRAIRFVVLVIVISFPIALIIASPLHGGDDDL